MPSSLADLSATSCRELLDSRAITARELLDAVLERHHETHQTINAVIATDLPAARLAAARADERLARGASLGRLDGIPITVKDNIGVRGMAASWGSRLFADRICEHDDFAVERLRERGAVIWGKTNTPEFALAATTENSLFGMTRNPRDTRLTPGGSSGGAAAALAAGVGPLSLATDAGGSARRPAAFTGTVGFRPSTGRIPRGPLFPNSTHDLQTLAPMARTVADVRILYETLAGPDPRDRASLTEPQTPSAPGHPVKICVFRQLNGKIVDRAVLAALNHVTHQLKHRNYLVEEIEAPFDLGQIERIWSVLISTFAASFVRQHQDWPDFSATIMGLAKTGQSLSAVDYRAALEEMNEIRRGIDQRMSGGEVFICPTSPCFPWAADTPFPGEIDGTPATLRDTAVFLPFANVAGLPAISIPVPGSVPPIGVQLIGRFGADRELLDMAETVEAIGGAA